MLDTAKALNGFYSSFGIPAYKNDNVPDDVTYPYLTYSLSFPQWDEPVTHFCTVYMRTESIQPLLAKADQIRRAIGTGRSIPCSDGCLYLFFEHADPVTTPDDGVKGIYIELELNVLHS